MHYIFPFNEIEKGSRIVLYGAGLVGQEFYAQIQATNYCEITAWIDKDFAFYQSKGMSVKVPEKIEDIEFDVLIVAIANEDIADSVIKEFSKGTDRRILWKKYSSGEPTEGIIRKDFKISEYNKLFPNNLITADNLDLSVRYLLCKDILNEIEDKDHLNLYMRYQMIISNLNEEGLGDYRKKRGADEFLKKFKELISLMRRDGFYETNPILVDEQNKIINGRHRCASAIALEKEIWASRIDGVYAGLRDYHWFYDNGFSLRDMQEILNGFTDMYRNCNVVLLFGSIKDQWNLVQKQFEHNLKIVGYIDLDFTNDYLGFENLIHDIYEDVNWDDPWKDRKIKLLRFAPLYIRVIVVSDEGKENIDVYQVTNDVKKSLRELFALDMGNRKDNISMHAADSYEEYKRLKEIFLSGNNLKYNSIRVMRSFRRDFINKLSELKSFLDNYEISYDRVCIVGSGGLEIYGLREAGDIDLIVHPDIAGRMKKLKENLPIGVEVIGQDSFLLDTGVVKDRQIIESEKLHYIFYGLKFINLDILMKRYAYKAKHNQDSKAEENVELLQMFFDYVKWFEDKRALQFQLKREADKYRWSV